MSNQRTTTDRQTPPPFTIGIAEEYLLVLRGSGALAALTQCLTRMLWRRQHDGRPWMIADNVLIDENRWRAQRYGVPERLIDLGRKAVFPFAQALDEILDLAAVFNAVIADGGEEQGALKAVVQALIIDFTADL